MFYLNIGNHVETSWDEHRNWDPQEPAEKELQIPSEKNTAKICLQTQMQCRLKKKKRLTGSKTILTLNTHIILKHPDSNTENWSPDWLRGDNMTRNLYYLNHCHLLGFFLHLIGHFPMPLSPSVSVKLLCDKCHYIKCCTNDSELNWVQI